MNRYRRYQRNAVALAVLCGLASFFTSQPQGWMRSFLLFVLVVWGVVAVPAGLFAAFLIGKTARRYEALVNGEGRLAEWLVDEAHWQRFRAIESDKARKGAWAGLAVFGLLGGCFGAAAVAVAFESKGELAVLFGVLAAAFVAFGWWLRRSSLAFANRVESPSPAWIGRDGAAFRGSYLTWRAFGVRVAGVDVDRENGLLRVDTMISAGDSETEVRQIIPFPAGKEDEAARVAGEILRAG